MLKKILSIITLSIISLNIFAESKVVKYVKGNISDKTAAVKEASGEEAEYLTEQALDYVLNNKELLGNDRDLDALAVATVLSLNNEYVAAQNDKSKAVLINKLSDLFRKYTTSPTVQTAVISKVVSQKDKLPVSVFTALLNTYISKTNINQIDASVAKAIFNSLEEIGNNESFLILYTLWSNPKYSSYSANIEHTLSCLVPVSMNEILSVVQQGNIDQLVSLFKLLKNSNIPTNFTCEIAENVLSETIIMMEDSSKITDSLIKIQNDSMKVLSENKWTRASTVALSYFELSKTLYSLGFFTPENMQDIITSLSSIAPVNSVSPLSKYLEELNSKKEQNENVSSEIVLSIIKTLGAIGDKSAFDSLLAVTYLPYPESVLSAARSALAGLRW